MIRLQPTRDALVLSLARRSIKNFRAPLAPESLSLCLAKEKVTQEKGHPAWRFPPIPGWKVRESEPGFSAARPCTVEKASASCRCPLRGLIVSASPPHRGPEQRARIGQLLLRCLHSGIPAFTCAHSPKNRQVCTAALSQRRSRCAPSAGQAWPALSSGPLCGGEGRTTRPEGGSTGMSSLFRPDRSPAEKPGRPSRTFHPWMGGKRQAGCRFLLVTSLLDKQKRSDSGAEGARKPLIQAISGAGASPGRGRGCAHR